MVTADRRLQLWEKLEAGVEAAASLPLACEAVSRFALEHSSLTEVLVIARASGARHLNPGLDGRQELSEAIRAAARVLSDPGDAWEGTQWGEVMARPIRSAAGVVAVLLARTRGTPGPDDAEILELIQTKAGRLLRAAVDRVILEERNLELATIYEIDHIRDEHLPFEQMLQRIMGRVLELIPADGAVVALRAVHQADEGLTLHARGRPQDETFARFVEAHRQELTDVVEEAFHAKSYLERRLADDRPRVVECMPLILDEEVLGGFLLISAPGRRFSARDQRLFKAVCSQTDTAIFEDLERQRLKDVFKRYVSRDVFEQMMTSGEDFLEGRRADVTCFFSDLRGFTAVSEQLEVGTVVAMLNEHLEAMTDIVFEHGGTVDKFIGDCVMAFFGAPLPQPDHTERAVRCAVAMRERHARMAEEWERRGLPGVKIGIGLHTGSVFVGPVGGENLVSYTIIGDNVNLASRLEGESGPDEIIITQAVRDRLGSAVDVEPRGELTVRGKTVPVEIFQVRGVKG